MSKQPWQQGLNAQQLEAASILDGPVLVIAGAGSGKTKTLEHRVLHLLERDVEPSSILLLSFTRRSAQLMLDRAAALDPRAAGVGGTFHGFAVQTLKRYAAVLGLPSGFTVIDEGDANTAVGKCIGRLNVAERSATRFPEAATVRTLISAAINRRITLQQAITEQCPHFLCHHDAIEAVQQEYRRYKLQAALLDFDDLLALLLVLLRHPTVGPELSRRHRFILIDEFQDTNHAQHDIALALAQSHGNLFVVGDDAQSIYAFRGARHENMLGFPDAFPDKRVAVIKLQQNYRSTQPILDVANAILSNMPRAFRKELKAATESGGEQPALMRFRDAREEAEFVAASIARNRNQGVALEDQAVLFRSGFYAMELQIALNARRIPYVVHGGMKLSEAAHVKDLISLLRIVSNCRDELAWNRALMLHPGIGHQTADRLATATAGAAGLAAALASVATEAESCTAKARHATTSLAAALQQIEKVLHPGEQFRLAIMYYKPFLERDYDDHPHRFEELQALAQIADRYKSLQSFLMELILDPLQQSRKASHSSDDDEPILTLTTIHSAKGAEWEHVHLIGAADGVLPSQRSIDREEDLQEEERLLYVALTRARSALTITMHLQTRASSGIASLCRFLDRPEILRLLRYSPAELEEERELLVAPQHAVLSSDRLAAELQRVCEPVQPIVPLPSDPAKVAKDSPGDEDELDGLSEIELGYLY